MFPSESGLPATDTGVTHLKEMQKNQVCDAIPTPPRPPWDQAEGRHRPVTSSLTALSGFLHSLSPEGMWLWSLYCACLPSLCFWKARSLLDPAVVRYIGQITTNAGSQGSPGSVSRPGNDLCTRVKPSGPVALPLLPFQGPADSLNPRKP